MATTVEIKTGKRRILEYLFSPLAEVTSEAMQERGQSALQQFAALAA
jgi:hemolysin D